MKCNFRFAFTLVELLTVIAVIAVLLTILIPVVSSVRRSAKQSVCSSQLRQIGQAVAMYNQDNEVPIPPSVDALVHSGLLKDQRLLHCPLDEKGNWGSTMAGSHFANSAPRVDRSYSFVREFIGEHPIEMLLPANRLTLFVCQMHGQARFKEESMGHSLSFYEGTVLRLHSDGSINTKQIDVPPSGALSSCWVFSDSKDCLH